MTFAIIAVANHATEQELSYPLPIKKRPVGFMRRRRPAKRTRTRPIMDREGL